LLSKAASGLIKKTAIPNNAHMRNNKLASGFTNLSQRETKVPLKKEKNYMKELVDTEKEKFGDRYPAGFKKIGLLGKGGIAIVWLAQD